jgi:hypothetical protein
MEADERGQRQSRQWTGPPLSDAIIRHLRWASFDAKRKDEALDALRTSSPKLYDIFVLREDPQVDVAKKLGITQSAVSKRLKAAYRFLAEYLLATDIDAPEKPSFASVAKTLGLSRKQLARELIGHLEPDEIGEALGLDPYFFAALTRALTEHPGRMRKVVRALESGDI